MKALYTVIVLILSANVAASEYSKEFSSPDKSCTLLYEGAASRGEGRFSDISNGKVQFYKGMFRYGPIVNWESHNLAELRIPTGSPNYHSYLYNCDLNKLSPRYNLLIAINNDKSIVATLDQGHIHFYYADTESPFYTHNVPEVGLGEFFIDCKSESYFIENNKFIITLACGNNVNYRYEINVPNN